MSRKTAVKKWIAIIDTKSYKGMSHYRKVMYMKGDSIEDVQKKCKELCKGQQIMSQSILPFDENLMDGALLDCTEKNPSPEHPNIDTRWITKYKLCETFYADNKHLKVPYKYVVDDVKLGQWIHKQRTDYRRGYLTDEQIRLLNDLEMIWRVTAKSKK